MKLVNKLPHKANTRFLLDGVVYEIDGAGCIEVEDEGHAGKLLQNENWRRAHAARTPVEREKVKVELIDKSGKRIAKDAQSLESNVPEKESATEEEPVVDPPIPEGENMEWADPDVQYSQEWLIACAKAYDVPKVSKRWSKEKLVEKIFDHMYEK